MKFFAIAFILSEIYYILYGSHLDKKFEQKLLMYKTKKWIISDLTYYVLSVLFWFWIGYMCVFFPKDTVVLLASISILVPILRWMDGKKYEIYYSLIRIILLLLVIIF